MFRVIRSLSLTSLFTNRNLQVDMDNFNEIRIDTSKVSHSNKYFVNNKPGGIVLEYYNEDKCIGYIKYYLGTGQIGLFFIQKEYQNRGLGKQILSKVMMDLQENNCDECWVVSAKGHNFWSNVFNKSFTYRVPVHKSVKGDGYFINLKNNQPENISQPISDYQLYSFQMVY